MSLKFNMRRAAVFIAALVAAALAASSPATEDVRGRVEGRVMLNALLSSWSLLPADTRVLLNNGEHVGFVKADGTFSIPNVPTGTYSVDVVATGLAFEKVRLDFVARDKAGTRASVVTPGTTVLDPPAVAYPLRLEPRMRLDYFSKRQGFSLWSLASNPMILMSGFVLLLGYGLPKLTEGVDLDALREEAAQPAAEARTIAAAGARPPAASATDTASNKRR